MKNKIVLTTSALMAISLLSSCGHTHKFGEATYTWSSDYKTCTATRVCLDDKTHVETETVNSTYLVVTAAKCEEDGAGKYTATFTNDAFEVQTKDVVVDAIGHAWDEIKYVWSEDYSTCTASITCLNDDSHSISETSESLYSVLVAPECESEGLASYDVGFENEIFEAQSVEEILPATGHVLVPHLAEEESCDTDGNTEYWSCLNCEKYFSDAEGKNEIEEDSWVIPQYGHDWGEPTYDWADDYSTCTATRTCANDESHVETETVDASFKETTPATYDATGEGTYTATFTNEAFEEQTATVTLDKLVYHGEIPLLSDDGETVTYGLYPQTNVNDTDLLEALNELTDAESNGWYLYDNEYYAKVAATPYDSSYTFNNGTTIVSGTTYWFKCEPITWNVLSNNDGEYYILSSVLLDTHRYDASSNNYANSEIRTWLNNDFYNSAFALGNSNILT